MNEAEPRRDAPEDAGEDTKRETVEPELPRKDILAMILALFQLFLPAIIALLIVGAVVAAILH